MLANAASWAALVIPARPVLVCVRCQHSDLAQYAAVIRLRWDPIRRHILIITYGFLGEREVAAFVLHSGSSSMV